MSRQARLFAILAVMGVIAVVALALVARQYSRVATPERSVADVPLPQAAAALREIGPDPAPAGTPAPAAVEEDAEAPGTAPSGSSADAPAAEAVPAPATAADPGRLAAWNGFVAGREAIRKWVEENRGPADDLVDEATGYQLGRERINMHTFKLFQVRVQRGRAALDAGLDEDGYRAVREQYRGWKDGTADVDPEWRRFLDADPERAASADLGVYEPIDF